MNDNDRLQVLSTLAVTILLIAFAAFMVRFVPGPNAETLGTVIITAVVAKWLQQGAQQSAEKTAAKLQEAVASATSTNGNGAPTQVAHMDVEADTATLSEKP